MNQTASETYAQNYLLRRNASTMTRIANDWFRENTRALLAGWQERENPESFSVLSIGAGDSELDLDVISGLFQTGSIPSPTRLRYVAIEPNPVHREQIIKRLSTEAAAPLTEYAVLEKPFPEHLPQAERFDLILMIHVLYYLAPRDNAINRAMSLLAPGGRLVIVQQTPTGIPELQAEFLETLKGSSEEMFTSIDMLQLLDHDGIHYEYSEVDTYLDVTECIMDTEYGRRVLSFCMECDLDTAKPVTTKKLLNALETAALEKGGRRVLREPLGIILVSDDNGSLSSEVPSVDFQDYSLLADAIDWPALFASPTNYASAVVRILDMPCGRGRWLDTMQRSIAAYEEWTEVRTPIAYDLLDLSHSALRQAQARLHPPFYVDRMFQCSFEQADFGVAVYDVIHSIHGLYAARESTLKEILQRMLAALKPNGVGIIVLTTRNSFYVRFWREFLQAFSDSMDDQYLAAEDVVSAFRSLNASLAIRQLRYEERIPVTETARLLRYLKEESTANCYPETFSSYNLTRLRDMPLETLLTHTTLGPYLRMHLDGDTYRFRQDVRLIFCGSPGTRLEWERGR